MNSPIKSKRIRNLLIGSAFALIFLTGLIIYGYYRINEASKANAWVNHTLEVIAKIQELEAHFNEISAAQRGYVITSKTEFRDSFEKSGQELLLKMNELGGLIKDNPSQVERHHRLRIIHTEKMGYHQRCILLIDEGKKAQASELVSTGKGQAYLLDVKKVLGEMNDHETQLLQKRLKTQQKNRLKAINIIGITSTTAILLVFYFIVMIFFAIRRQEKIQADLYENSQVQNAILHAAAFALIAVDRFGHITLFNPAAEKLLGYKSDEVLGKSPIIFHVPAEVEAIAKSLSERFNENVPPDLSAFTYRADHDIVESDQVTYVRKDGSKVPVMLTVSGIRDQEGNMNGHIGIGFDISTQKEFEDALIKAKEQALEGTQAKSEFLANMSHEIRTPMNAIMGMAELLKETPLAEDQKKYVEVFQQAGNSLLNLINDILDISKIEAGNFELYHSPFMFTQMLSKATNMMALKAHQKGLELAVDVDTHIIDHYMGDADRLRQVIVNLLGNAIKFTKKGEVILRVLAGETSGSSQEIIVEIQDTGIGMSPSHVEKLFQRFTQADSSITKEFGGTGLGLNITRKLLELMGGKIKVESQLDVGTKFTLNFNLDICIDAAVKTKTLDLKGLKVLVVDDTKTNRVILRKILENELAVVTEADSGEEAIIKLEEEEFDLVLLDCRMPDMSGFAVAERMRNRADENSPSVIMLTSDDRPGDMARAKELGLWSYLIKPIMKNDLLEAIEKSRTGLLVSEKKAETPDIPEEQLDKRRLLLVDDNDENRLIICSFLKNTSWVIDEARNGIEALHFAQETKYDTILMDMQMPIMDGYTATKKIRKVESLRGEARSKILALTAYALREEMEKSQEAGCDGHLTKPISKSELIRALSGGLGEIMEVKIDSELEDLVPEYLETRKSEIFKIEMAIKSKDFKSIQVIGHKLRGTAGSYGFAELSRIGKELEEKAIVQDMSSIEKSLDQYKNYMSNLKVVYAH